MEEMKEYFTIDEVEKIVSRNRATIYNRMKILGIKAKKFKLDKRSYITAADVERIKNVFAKPWTLGEKTEDGAGSGQGNVEPAA